MTHSNNKLGTGEQTGTISLDKTSVSKECDTTFKFKKKLTRRDFLHSTGIIYAASAMTNANLVCASGGDDDEDEDETVPILPPSPYTKPWQMQLPEEITYLESRPLNPSPSKKANVGKAEAGRKDHQFWDEIIEKFPNFKDYTYEVFAVQFDNWRYHPDYPEQPHWGYQENPYAVDDGKMMPSVIVAAHYGYPILCRMHNELPPDHEGFGTPEISTHLHNLHCASESDGFPGDYFSHTIKGPTLTAPGEFKDHLYINLKAGFTKKNDNGQFVIDGNGDPDEALGTLFYHDHTENFTAPNVYRGLAGFYLLFDDKDTGNENDPNGLQLPSGNYDYPFNICDRRFDEQGVLYYDQLNPEGVLGDKVVINGRIEPIWKVSRRKYRMRLLNSGPSRFYDLAIVNERNETQGFIYIANDGNLLEYPLMNTKSVALSVAERGDIIMDFSKYGSKEQGAVLYLVNRLVQTSTRKPDKVRTPGQRIMKIIVTPGDVTDPSLPIPLTKSTLLRPLPAKFRLTEEQIKNLPVRRWRFERNGGMWTVNDKLFNVNNPVVKIKRGTAQVWELINSSGGWAHPIHIHFEEGRVLSKVVDGVKVPVPPHQKGRKDVYLLEPNSSIRVYLDFRDFIGKYVMHCHNLVHEDHAMMVRWDIED